MVRYEPDVTKVPILLDNVNEEMYVVLNATEPTVV